MNVHHAELREPSYMHPRAIDLSDTARINRAIAADVLQARLVLDLTTQYRDSLRQVYAFQSTPQERIMEPDDFVLAAQDLMVDAQASVDALEGRRLA
jgi:hypothetical protein